MYVTQGRRGKRKRLHYTNSAVLKKESCHKSIHVTPSEQRVSSPTMSSAPSLRDTIAAYNNRADDNAQKLRRNPFSDQYEQPAHSKNDGRYGRPEAGSKTERRGIKAGKDDVKVLGAALPAHLSTVSYENRRLRVPRGAVSNGDH